MQVVVYAGTTVIIEQVMYFSLQIPEAALFGSGSVAVLPLVSSHSGQRRFVILHEWQGKSHPITPHHSNSISSTQASLVVRYGLPEDASIL